MLVKLLLLRMVYLTKIVGSLLLLDNLGFVLFVLFSTQYNILEHILTLVSIFKVLFSLFFFLWKKKKPDATGLGSFFISLLSIPVLYLFSPPCCFSERSWKQMGLLSWSSEIKYQKKIKVDIFSMINSWKKKV